MTLRSRLTARILVTITVASLGLVGLAGCGSGNKQTNPNPGGGGTTTFTGTVTGAGVNGKLTVTINATALKTSGARAAVTATGTYTPAGGSAISLTVGGYDTESNQLVVSQNGGAGGWNFGGELVGTRINGQVAGPGGETGYFTLVEDTGSEVIVLIGSYTSNTMGGPTGSFNVSIDGGEVHGTALPDGLDSPIPLDGTFVSGTGAISIVNPAAPGGPPLATGTYNASTGEASGNYDDGKGDTGTWSGTRQQ